MNANLANLTVDALDPPLLNAREIRNVEEKVVVIHRDRCNNKVYYRLSHDVVT